jgi:hypothetical protein
MILSEDTYYGYLQNEGSRRGSSSGMIDEFSDFEGPVLELAGCNFFG